DPAFLIARYASPQKFAAVARVLWPLAFLPLHAPSLTALALPVVAYLLLSNKASVSQLQFWYVTPILPILFVATAAAIGNAPPRRAQWLTLALFVASVLGYLWLGAGPFAANDEPARFAVTERTECGQRLLALVPPDASLSAQDNLMPHLAQRHNVWVFPSMGEPLAEFVALDTRYEFAGGYSNWPTVRPLEVPAVVNRFLSQPAYDLVGDGCDYKILRHSDAPTIPRARAQLFGQQIAMLGYEVAVADERGIYHSGLGTWDMGRSLRVIVWWQSVGHMLQDYTVFVHALDATGRVVGQHDSPPANGFRPTSQWNDGETVRDIHYFTLDGDATQIEVGLYDARTGRRLLLGDGGDAVNVTRDK
ncbi:MAG: DUF2079 domain-containing protein, partial [Chloroflexota bacterium]